MPTDRRHSGTDQPQLAMGESLASLLRWMLQQAQAVPPKQTRSYVSIKLQMGVLRTWCARVEAALEAVSPLDPPSELYNEYVQHIIWSMLSLPRKVLVRHHRTGAVVALRRGYSGYQPAESDATPESFNAGVTADQIKAMYMGAFFGWNIILADANVVKARREQAERERAASADAAQGAG